MTFFGRARTTLRKFWGWVKACVKHPLKCLAKYGLKLVRLLGRIMFLAPTGTVGTGGYGRAFQGGISLLYLIGLALALWGDARGVGIAFMVVATAALVHYYLLAYRGDWYTPRKLVWLVFVTAVLVAGIGIVWSQWSEGEAVAGDVAVLSAIAGVLIAIALVRYLFGEVFGPFHPESPIPAADDTPPLWYWERIPTSS